MRLPTVPVIEKCRGLGHVQTDNPRRDVTLLLVFKLSSAKLQLCPVCPAPGIWLELPVQRGDEPYYYIYVYEQFNVVYEVDGRYDPVSQCGISEPEASATP